MALRAIELRQEIDRNRTALTRAEEKLAKMLKRSEELADKVAEAAADEAARKAVEEEVEAYEGEKAEAEAEAGSIRTVIEDLEKELQELEAQQPSQEEETKEETLTREKEKKMDIRESREYIEAYARYIKTGKDTECRSLLTENVSGGTVPVPTMVDGVVRTAWDKETIMSAVTKTYLKGNVKVGFEISATGAVVHTEGAAAPAEETLTLGIVTMVPANIKKWITISDEALDLNGEAFLQYIYSELTYQIAKKAADMLIAAIAAAPAASTATAAGQKQITAGVAQDTIVNAIANLSDEAANPCIIMNKATYAAFKSAQYAGNFNTDIFEGLEVKFNNSLPAYATASTGAVYCIVGDLGRGAQANLPNGDTITFTYDDLSLSEKDLVKIVGREYVGLGVVAPNAFCNIKKPSAG